MRITITQNNMSNEKAKQEVLEGYFGSDFYLIKQRDDLQYILRAMDEYADQQTALLQKRIKELEDGINLLIEDYKGRINAVNDLIDSDSNNGSNNAIRRQERLVTKRGEYNSFITDLSKLNNPTP